MRFLYLIQGKSENVKKYSYLNSGHSSLCGLTYDKPLKGFDYFPNSSYSQGRNHLFRAATEQLEKFDYFIFLDDDVEFEKGSFGQMEQNLKRAKPSIGVPITDRTRCSAIAFEWRDRIYPIVRSQRFHLNDEQYLAFNKEVISEKKVLPYLEAWDNESWFVASLIQQALIQLYYFDTARQFNDCVIRNDQHANYPQNLAFAIKTSEHYLNTHYSPSRKRPAEYCTLVKIDRSVFTTIHRMLRALFALVRRNSGYRSIMRYCRAPLKGT